MHRSGPQEPERPASFVALEHVRILLREDLAGDVLGDEFLDLLRGRPDVAQEYRVAVLIFTKRLLGQVLGNRTGKSVSDDERRRSKVVCLHVRRNAAFEVTVAGQNGSRDQALSLIVLEIGAGSGPELPMQVVQPKPTRLKPSASRSFWRPADSR